MNRRVTIVHGDILETRSRRADRGASLTKSLRNLPVLHHLGGHSSSAWNRLRHRKSWYPDRSTGSRRAHGRPTAKHEPAGVGRAVLLHGTDCGKGACGCVLSCAESGFGRGSSGSPARPRLPRMSEQNEFFEVARAGFSQPRKQLRNSLASGLRLAPRDCRGLARSGRGRPETPRRDANPC